MTASHPEWMLIDLMIRSVRFGRLVRMQHMLIDGGIWLSNVDAIKFID